MKNKISSGKLVNVTLAADIASGAGLLVGALFGVAVTAGKSGDVIAVDTDGEFELPAATGAALTVGQLAYWDVTNKRVTGTAADNTLIGHVTVAKASAAAVATVRIR